MLCISVDVIVSAVHHFLDIYKFKTFSLIALFNTVSFSVAVYLTRFEPKLIVIVSSINRSEKSNLENIPFHHKK